MKDSGAADHGFTLFMGSSGLHTTQSFFSRDHANLVSLILFYTSKLDGAVRHRKRPITTEAARSVCSNDCLPHEHIASASPPFNQLVGLWSGIIIIQNKALTHTHTHTHTYTHTHTHTLSKKNENLFPKYGTLIIVLDLVLPLVQLVP